MNKTFLVQIALFFEVFSFALIDGHLENALKDPSGVLITEKTTRKYFGEEDPMDQLLSFKDNDDHYLFKNNRHITGHPPEFAFSF